MEKALENQVKEYFRKNPSRSSVFMNEDETEYQNHKGGEFVNEVSRYDLLGDKKPKDPAGEKGKTEKGDKKPKDPAGEK